MKLWKRAKKILAAACCLAVALSLIPAAGAAEAGPVKSNNKNDEDYTLWASPVNSYLYENPSGGLTRVEYISGQVVIEDYDSSFHYLSGRTIAPELPLWGGFYAGKDYNFLIFGQENRSESSSVEVIRVVKYDKSWNRLGQTSLKGANTTEPFNAGSLRCDEYNGYLYIRTCHEMFKYNGINHQANLMMAIREQDMTLTDSFYDIWNTDYGYISHSFNQFILVDQDGYIVTLDHGDAMTRGVVYMKYSTKASKGKFSGQQYGKWCSYSLLQLFPGVDGDNATGASIGGLAETSSGYVAAYNYDQKGGGGERYIYLHWIDKASGKGQQHQITQTPGATTPILASTGLNGGYLMWNGKSGYQVSDTLYYLQYGADGQPGAVQTATGVLSDCQPIYYNGKVTWYSTNYSVPTFYQLDASGVKATVANTAPAVQPEQPTAPAQSESKTAEPTNDKLYVDGELAVPTAYKIGGSNYFKIRDVAALLNGTDAQFSVDYDDDTKIVYLVTGQSYTKKSSDLAGVPSGSKEAISTNDSTYVNGEKVELTVYKIGGSNYFKLRDLGKALGFNVGYTDGYGAFIETDKPYGA